MVWIYRLVLVVAIAAVYAPVVHFSFVEFDDQLVITENPSIQQGLTPEGVSWAFTTLHFANWMPITWLTHLLDWELWQSWAGGHHLQNVLWHLLGTMFLFESCRLAFASPPRRDAVAFAVAMIWALHPLHVESVAWVSERKGVVSTAFALLTLLLYTIYTRQPGPDRMSLVVVSLGLGLMAKPMLVTLPALLLLWDIWPLRRFEADLTWWSAIREKGVLFFVAALVVPIAYFTQHQGEAVSTLEGLPLEYRLRNLDVSLVTYLRRWVWPSDLIPFYPHPKDSISTAWALGCAGILAGITGWVAFVAKRAPWLAVGWIWFFVAMLPVSGLVPVGSHGMADRYSDLPLIGLVLAGVYAVSNSRAWKQLPSLAQIGSLLAVCLVLAILSFRQVLSWKDTRTLFTHTLAVDPDNIMALNEWAMMAWKEKDLTQAEQLLSKAVQTDPGFFLAQRNLALLYREKGELARAETHFREAAEWGDAESWVDLAELQWSAGDAEKAMESCDAALLTGVRTPRAWTLRGFFLIGQKKLEDAEKSLLEAISLDPKLAAPRRHLGVVYLQQNKLDSARLQFAWAASLDPKIADEVEQLVAQSKEQDPILLDISAACLSEVEKFGVACRRIEAALILAAKQGRADLVPGMQSRLRAYLQDQNYLSFVVTQLPSQ